MPTVDVVNLENKVVGRVELADEVFGAQVNEALLYEAVRHYRACQRAGTHKTKERGSVAGSGKKLWRQKGTGRARIGSIRSPLWRHGGTAHGPQPRDYSYHLPKKMLVGALRSALSAKLQEGRLTVVENLDLPSQKTKEFRQGLDRLGSEKSVLLVSNGENQNLERSSRNLPRVTLLASREVNPYHLLDHERVILTQATAQKLSEALR
ncbi:MAG: 50S ribosomal protein L4 [Acidobacteria bacterium]|nr:50S ribosomal protein L4 [Acidobacteriota bacterium]